MGQQSASSGRCTFAGCAVRHLRDARDCVPTGPESHTAGIRRDTSSVHASTLYNEARTQVTSYRSVRQTPSVPEERPPQQPDRPSCSLREPARSVLCSSEGGDGSAVSTDISLRECRRCPRARRLTRTRSQQDSENRAYPQRCLKCHLVRVARARRRRGRIPL